MKRAIRRILEAIIPRTFEKIQSIRARRHVQALQREWGMDDLEDRLFATLPLITHHGPFTGMRWTRAKTSGSLIPLVIGSYESELWPIIGQVIASRYRRVIDIGCAEGYYAVGLARRMAEADVHAFDLDPHSRKVCAAHSTLNNVASNVHIAGRCSVQTLRSLVDDSTFILSDCEGGEFELLQPDAVPQLSHADVLVELHDALDAPRSTKLLRSFEPTHSIQIIRSMPRDAALFPELNCLPDEADRRRAIEEVRDPSHSWLWMQRRSIR